MDGSIPILTLLTLPVFWIRSCHVNRVFWLPSPEKGHVQDQQYPGKGMRNTLILFKLLYTCKHPNCTMKSCRRSFHFAIFQFAFCGTCILFGSQTAWGVFLPCATWLFTVHAVPQEDDRHHKEIKEAPTFWGLGSNSHLTAYLEKELDVLKFLREACETPPTSHESFMPII